MVRLDHHVVLSEPPYFWVSPSCRAITVSTHPLTSSQPVSVVGLCQSDQDSECSKALV